MAEGRGGQRIVERVQVLRAVVGPAHLGLEAHQDVRARPDGQTGEQPAAVLAALRVVRSVQPETRVDLAPVVGADVAFPFDAVRVAGERSAARARAAEGVRVVGHEAEEAQLVLEPGGAVREQALPGDVAAEVVAAEVGQAHVGLAREPSRLRPAVAGPEMAVDDVRPPLEADVVDVEAGIDRTHGGVEEEVAFLLVHRGAAGEAAQRGPRGIEPDVGRVRALEVMLRVLLQVGDARGRSRDVGGRGPARDHPRLVRAQEGPAVEAEGEGVRVELVAEAAVAQAAHDAGGHHPEAAPVVRRLAQRARHHVLRGRLHLGAEAPFALQEVRGLGGGDGVEGPQAPAVAQAAGQLRGHDDARARGRVGEVRVRQRALGRAADAAAVEQVGPAPVEAPPVRRPALAEPEVVGPLHEEGPLLGEERLHVAEVHDGGIDLHLAEVGVDGAVDGQVAAEADLEVRAHGRAHARAVVEGIARVVARELGLGRRVGRDRDAAWRHDALEPAQLREARHEAAGLLGRVGDVVFFLGPAYVAPEVHAPGIGVLAPEAKLRVWNAHLHRPALAVHVGAPFPDAVPAVVVPVVVVEHAVAQRTRGVDGEIVAAPPVVIRVHIESQLVRAEACVAAAEAADDRARLGVEQAGADVDRLVVVGDPHFRFLRRSRPLRGVALGERRHRGRGGPDLLVEEAVHHDGRRRPRGVDGRRLRFNRLDVLARSRQGEQQRGRVHLGTHSQWITRFP